MKMRLLFLHCRNGSPISQIEPTTSETDPRQSMKNHTLHRFPWRWAAAALLLLGNASPLFAQPTVTLDPADLSVHTGNNATFNATATGSGTLTVQWQERSDSGSTWSTVWTDGPTPSPFSTTYSFSAALTQNGHQFRAKFTDANGSTPSHPATLTVGDYVLKLGRIEVDLTLDGGLSGNQSADFATFWNNPAVKVVTGVGYLVDGSFNISGRSPVKGDNYRLLCDLSSQSFTYPFLNTVPLQPPGTMDTPSASASALSEDTHVPHSADSRYDLPHYGHFVLFASTGQPATPGQIDDACFPDWVDYRLDLYDDATHPGHIQHYYPISFRSNVLLPNDGGPGAPVDKYTIDNTLPNGVREPVGAIHVTAKCGGHTLSVSSATITARLAQSTPPLPQTCLPTYSPRPGDPGTVQASVDLPPLPHLPNNPPPPFALEDTFLVRADNSYDVTIQFATSDAGGDVVGEYTAPTTVTVHQGKVVDVEILVDGVFCDNGGGCVSAVGRLELLNQDVFAFGQQFGLPPYVVITDGPFKNRRYAIMGDVSLPISPVLNPPIPDANFKLIDVLPSEAEFPSTYTTQDYVPWANVVFQPSGSFLEILELMAEPRLFGCTLPLHNPDDGQYPPLPVLTDFNQMTHGDVMGHIHFEGPPCGGPSTCVQLITAANDLVPSPSDRKLYDTYSYVQFNGRGYGPLGSSRAWGTIQRQAMSATSWDGSWNLWLTEPNQTAPVNSSQWDVSGSGVFRLDNPDYPGDNQHRSWLIIADYSLVQPHQIPHGQTTVISSEYCLSYLDVNFLNQTGGEIEAPKLAAGVEPPSTRTYVGTDPLNPNKTVNYKVDATFWGTPTAYAASDANIHLCLPQGHYLLSPGGAFLSADGHAQPNVPFPPFKMDVGCKECITVTVTTNGIAPIIRLAGDRLPCTSNANYVVQGIVQAEQGHTIANVSYTVSSANGVTSGTLCSGNCSTLFDLGGTSVPLQACVNTVTITATDDRGLTSSSTPFTITLDSTPPTITGVPADTTVECNAVPVGPATLPAHDTCDAMVTVATLNADQILAGGCPGRYTITRTWTATDTCLNAATATQIIHVVDTTPPVINAPDITVDCTSVDGAVLSTYPTPTASDGCSGPVTFSYDVGLPHTFPLGVTPVVCTATDGCGNSTTCTLRVIVLAHGSDRWAWARRAGDWYGDPAQPAIGNGAAVDKWGNVFVTGSYQDALTFRNQNGTAVQTLLGLGGNDIFLAKYDSAGTLLWAVRAGGTGFDSGNGVAVDGDGNVYVTGGFSGTATFYSYVSSTVDIPFAPPLISAGGIDIFVAKYSPSGTCQWITQDGDRFNDAGAGIAVSTDGSIVFVAGNWGVAASQGAGFVNRYSSSGTVVTKLGQVLSLHAADQHAQALAIALDPSGNAYVTGIYDTLKTSPMAFGCALPDTGGAGRMFVVKFDPNLGCVWAAHSGHGISTTGGHAGEGIAVDPTGPYCYATAYFSGLADFGSGQTVLRPINTLPTPTLYNYLIVKLHTDTGLPVWATAGPTADTDDGETRAIAVGPDGNPCVTGFVQPAAPNNGVNEGPMVIVRSYDATSAMLRWSRDALYGGQFPGAPLDIGRGIAVGPAGCVAVTGKFSEDLSFPPAGGPVPTLNSSDPNVSVTDMFVAQMCPTCCPPDAPRPELKITGSGRNVMLSWDGPCCHLESTTDLFGNPVIWSYVGDTPPITLQNLGDQSYFFRLVCP
jgi:hypothetical protein